MQVVGVLLRAVPGVSGKREEGLEEAFRYQPHLLGEPVASGADPPVAEDVEGRGPEELLLGVGRPARCGVDPGRPARRADEDQPRHGKPEPGGRLERLPLQGHRPDLRRPPEGHHLPGLALVPPEGVLGQQPRGEPQVLGEHVGDLVRRDGPDPGGVVLEAPQQDGLVRRPPAAISARPWARPPGPAGTIGSCRLHCSCSFSSFSCLGAAPGRSPASRRSGRGGPPPASRSTASPSP